jgi:hypothetical protein
MKMCAAAQAERTHLQAPKLVQTEKEQQESEDKKNEDGPSSTLPPPDYSTIFTPAAAVGSVADPPLLAPSFAYDEQHPLHW